MIEKELRKILKKITMISFCGKDEKKMSLIGRPFGDGRPGWHIECSAMSEYLGSNLIFTVAN